LNELRIILSKHLGHFYKSDPEILESLGSNKMRIPIAEIFQDWPFLIPHDWGKLQEITDHDDLHPTERCAIPAMHSKRDINSIQQVGSDHRHLVDD